MRNQLGKGKRYTLEGMPRTEWFGPATDRGRARVAICHATGEGVVNADHCGTDADTVQRLGEFLLEFAEKMRKVQAETRAVG